MTKQFACIECLKGYDSEQEADACPCCDDAMFGVNKPLFNPFHNIMGKPKKPSVHKEGD